MAYKRIAKKKQDLRTNPTDINTSMGRYYLENKLVKILNDRRRG